jgi:hypothetical protein
MNIGNIGLPFRDDQFVHTYHTHIVWLFAVKCAKFEVMFKI